ncbi:MAG TPA: hypothetical protein VK184_12155 [Nostocaceae cyanobacterium]|nr:hypothetical protein [Nostocaceae cyanobacterium]
MEIREIKKAKPPESSTETKPDQPIEAVKPQPPAEAVKPQPPAEVVKLQRPSEETKPQQSSEFIKPRKYGDGSKPRKPYNKEKIQKFQHVKIIDCDQPVSRVICECWHCQQGLLIQVEVAPADYKEVECPSCGKTAVRLMAGQILSTVPIPSPWS